MDTEAKKRFGTWMTASDGLIEHGGVTKAATGDTEAINMKDPRDKGNPGHPEFELDSMHREFAMPANTEPQNTNGGTDSLFGLSTVTDPAPTGEGKQVATRNGDEKDKAYTTAGAPLNKIAQSAFNLTAGRTDGFKMPASVRQEPGLMQKLATCVQFASGTQEEQNRVLTELVRTCGKDVASAFCKEAGAVMQLMDNYADARQARRQELSKQAAAAQQQDTVEMFKEATAKVHAANLAQFPDTPEGNMLKMAYQQGAEDAIAAAGSPDGSIPSENDISDDEIMAMLQQLEAQGVSREDIELLAQILSADGSLGGDPAAIAAELEQGAASGDIDPQLAQALAQAIVQEHPELAGGGAPAPAPEAAAAEAPVEKEASVRLARGINDVASASLATLFPA